MVPLAALKPAIEGSQWLEQTIKVRATRRDATPGARAREP
jgi:hypothetical protein